ncbi:unknown [Tannerella sp. CAG:118]|nr:unknown [Tannerella sp. CAG:118]
MVLYFIEYIKLEYGEKYIFMSVFFILGLVGLILNDNGALFYRFCQTVNIYFSL